jgi:hypothetical protein
MQKPFAITLDVGSSLVNHTGSWRNSRPVYVSRKPPCNHQCPAGENIQAWLFHAESGDYEQAWRKLVEDNPFPATMGRVCYHTCEGACNRAKIDEAVGINSVEGFWVIRPSPGAGGSRLQRRNPERKCWLSARVRPASRRPTTWRAWAMP